MILMGIIGDDLEVCAKVAAKVKVGFRPLHFGSYCPSAVAFSVFLASCRALLPTRVVSCNES